KGIYVQTLALAYTHAHGVPLAYRDRPLIAWYGDMELAGHVWSVLKRAPLDVHVRISRPVAMERFPDRKALARFCEEQVRRDLSLLISNRRPGADPARAAGEALDPGPNRD
ncbi:MAG: 1-acyl-sn-glycerol-3-phosphate acyltransferase, partial [Alphaproteobacteria bacterium]